MVRISAVTLGKGGESGVGLHNGHNRKYKGRALQTRPYDVQNIIPQNGTDKSVPYGVCFVAGTDHRYNLQDTDASYKNKTTTSGRRYVIFSEAYSSSAHSSCINCSTEAAETFNNLFSIVKLHSSWMTSPCLTN